MKPLSRIAASAAAIATVAAATVLSPATAFADPSPDAVISEVYGGGGNSGATLTQDFVELGNRGTTAFDLTGLSVQYRSQAGGAFLSNTTALTGSIAPGGRYLVAQARGSGGTVELPTPDVTGTISMSGTDGVVALAVGTEPLTCNTPAECVADRRVVDLVGYGGAQIREGTAAPRTSNTTSVARAANLADTDDNSVDFTLGAPTPMNSGGGEPPPSPTPSPSPSPSPSPTPPVGTSVRIHDIQGNTRVSPLVGQLVAAPGVVTAVRAFGSARGFWFQDPEPDADPATSEGLFVFTGSNTPAVTPGDAVTVTGTVSEFRPGGNDSSNQSITQLTGATVTVESSGNPLPAAEVITERTVPRLYTPTANGSIEPLVLQPTAFALDFYESREGMRIRVEDPRVVGETDEFNGLWVTSKPRENPTAFGGTLYASYNDQNSGRLKIESLIPFAERPFPQANVGDRLAGVTEGPLDYTRFGGYVLQSTALGEVVAGGRSPEVTDPASSAQLVVSTFNVENLSAIDDQATFDRLGAQVAVNMRGPDIIGVEEIQDNTGPTNNGVVASDLTLTRLVDAIAAAGGPRYEFRVIDPENNQDGGQPGGNIRVVFLFNPERVTFVDRPGGDATTAVQAVPAPGGGAALSISPGRVDPQNPAWENSRKPLAGEFTFNGRTVFVIANHFASKGGDDALHGRIQPPVRSSEVQRTQQATVLRGFVDQLTAIDRNAQIAVVGDLNDFPFSPTLDILTQQGGLRSLIDTLPRNQRYNYVFDGNSQVLDHILVSRRVQRADYDVVRINAEFAGQASDHDPQIARLTLRAPR